MVINISKVIQIVDTVAGQDDKTKTRIVHGVQSHAGLDFMPLLHRNQNVCMLLHGRKDYGWPSSVVRALKDARDSKVDGMITTYMKKKDPMGEEHIDLDDKSRATAYYDAEVPMAMELSMPAFISKDGTKVKVTQVVVLTSPKRNDKVLIELSNPTITWLKHMCISAEGDESGDPGDDEADEAQMFELVGPRQDQSCQKQAPAEAQDRLHVLCGLQSKTWGQKDASAERHQISSRCRA